jgi:HlyD family secretion protein
MIPTIKLPAFSLLAATVFFIQGCGSSGDDADAYGNFETSEVIVSAQSQGVLQSLDINEGSIVEKGNIVGHIDSSTSWLKKEQLLAQKSVIRSRKNNIDAQLKVQNEQRINLEKEVRRLENLLRENAATQQQWDDITGKLRVLDSQTEAIRSQKNIIIGEQAVLDAQIDEVENLLEKCRIESPISGTILEKYADAGELVSPGKALFKVANMEEMELRVYISGSQLSSIEIGDTVLVRIDGPGDSLESVKGVVSWIASQVEFTPKIIQTKEERVNMVYAVKIRVNNDGRLKIGMPGEVVWSKNHE